RVTFDHEHGEVWRVDGSDPLSLLNSAGPRGLTTTELAARRADDEKPTDTDRRNAKRDLDRLRRQGLATVREEPTPRGGSMTKRYFAAALEGQGELPLHVQDGGS